MYGLADAEDMYGIVKDLNYYNKTIFPTYEAF